jgi:hypothetical protein
MDPPEGHGEHLHALQCDMLKRNSSENTAVMAMLRASLKSLAVGIEMLCSASARRRRVFSSLSRPHSARAERSRVICGSFFSHWRFVNLGVTPCPCPVRDELKVTGQNDLPLLPEPSRLAGYSALIDQYRLPVVLPPLLAATSERHTQASGDRPCLRSERARSAPQKAQRFGPFFHFTRTGSEKVSATLGAISCVGPPLLAAPGR